MIHQNQNHWQFPDGLIRSVKSEEQKQEETLDTLDMAILKCIKSCSMESYLFILILFW